MARLTTFSKLLIIVTVIAVGVSFIRFLFSDSKEVSDYKNTYEYTNVIHDIGLNVSEKISSAGVESVLIADMTNLEGEKKNLGRYLTEEISAEIIDVRKGISLLDRSQLNKLIKEQELNAAGLLDQETIAGLGEIIGTEVIITGKYEVIGDKVKLWLRAIDVEKGKAFFIEDFMMLLNEDLQSIYDSDNSWWN
ncbi:hypothetical protein [Lewinella sp. LCG006]|uniref:hypothetical protein n=1 Tax=Lewinella sp. LCG006 TaxID=3231911 RepID=UPI00345F6F09